VLQKGKEIRGGTITAVEGEGEGTVDIPDAFKKQFVGAVTYIHPSSNA